MTGDSCQAYGDHLLAAGCPNSAASDATSQVALCESMRSKTASQCLNLYDAQFACAAQQPTTCTTSGVPDTSTIGGCQSQASACAQCNGSLCGVPGM